MPFYIKLLLSVTIIVLATQIGRHFPALGGLVATMPLRRYCPGLALFR